MHKLVVLYPEPADPDHFRDYYVTNHLPLVMKMPGLLAWRYSFDVAAPNGDSPYSRSSRPTSPTATPWPRHGHHSPAGGRPPMSSTTPPAVRSSSTIRCRTAPSEAGPRPGRVRPIVRPRGSTRVSEAEQPLHATHRSDRCRQRPRAAPLAASPS